METISYEQFLAAQLQQQSRLTFTKGSKGKVEYTPLEIQGRRWFRKLVPKPESKAKALFDIYPLNTLSDKLVICYTPPEEVLPPFYQGKEIKRIFSLFADYMEFAVYAQKFPSHQRHFYEVVLGEYLQKTHFDLDIKLDKLPPGAELASFHATALQELIQAVIEVYREELQIELDLTRDLLIYNSHGTTVRSNHLIVTNYAHRNNREAGKFYELVAKRVPEPYCRYIDHSVYAPRQQFRLLKSSKRGETRYKTFEETFEFNGVSYQHVYPEVCENEAMLQLCQLYESLIAFTVGCKQLPSLLPLEAAKSMIPGYDTMTEQEPLSRTQVDRCLLLMREKLRFAPFSLREVQGHLIILNREQPSACPTCWDPNRNEPQIHTQEHPYIIVRNGRVFWTCRRAHEHVGRDSMAAAEEYLLGYLLLDDTEVIGEESPQTDNTTTNKVRTEEAPGPCLRLGIFFGGAVADEEPEAVSVKTPPVNRTRSFEVKSPRTIKLQSSKSAENVSRTTPKPEVRRSVLEIVAEVTQVQERKKNQVISTSVLHDLW